MYNVPVSGLHETQPNTAVKERGGPRDDKPRCAKEILLSTLCLTRLRCSTANSTISCCSRDGPLGSLIRPAAAMQAPQPAPVQPVQVQAAPIAGAAPPWKKTWHDAQRDRAERQSLVNSM